MNASALETTVVDDPYKVRHIEIGLTNADYLHLNKLIQQAPMRGSHLALYEAIGYLVTYISHGNYDHARIYRDRDDMIAFYWNDSNGEALGRRFTMGAIWRPELGKFTFHS